VLFGQHQENNIKMEKSTRSQSSFEADSQDLHLQHKMRVIRMVDSARSGTTLLALLMGLTVLGISANTLRVYNETHVSSEFMLPLWPDDFNIRPTISLVIGSAIVLISNLIALCFSHVGAVSPFLTPFPLIPFLPTSY
jgi:hypothetical protein